ncbi:MAG: MoaD/ThiS family protein [Verrucomicrobiae bacterium]|nr:MoaD/ThiS family protein [Verrucomicrobiae bacterium]
MTVTVYYFALLQDQRGLSEEKLELEPQDAATLYQDLKEKHGFSLDQTALRISVNEHFVSWDTELSDGDTVVFIPPVSGG